VYVYVLALSLLFVCRQTLKQEKTQKKTRRKTAQEQNTNGKHVECDHVKKRQRSRILQAYENKYMKNPTHLRMAMEAETCSERQWKPTHNKAARRRRHNLQNPLNNAVQQDAKISTFYMPPS
jgi:hypothetical protein